MSKSDYDPIEGERIIKQIGNIEEKEQIASLFLPYLLICFSKIEKLKRGLELDQKIKSLLKSLWKYIKNVNNNEIKYIDKSIIDFETEFYKKELIIFKFSYPSINLKDLEIVLELLLNEFHEEI